MMLAVPFYSQYAPEVPVEWRRRACGIAALHMALAAKDASGAIRTDSLIEEGIASGAYVPGIGWKHDGLLALALAHGVPAYRKEFGTRKFPRRFRTLLSPIAHWFAGNGVHILRKTLDRGAIPIVSLTTGSTDTHLVVLTGYEKGNAAGFYYHDPAGEEKDNKNRFMDGATFAKRWRQMALFIG
jgi:hypothetical protein